MTNECDYEYQTRHLWGLNESIREKDLVPGVDFGLLVNFAAMMSDSGKAIATEKLRPLAESLLELRNILAERKTSLSDAAALTRANDALAIFEDSSTFAK